jgi:hypothetical protein
VKLQSICPVSVCTLVDQIATYQVHRALKGPS